MVKITNASFRQDLDLPSEEELRLLAKDQRVKIYVGRLYDPEHVRGVLTKGSAGIRLWTRKCNNDVTQKLEWDLDDVAAFLTEVLEFGEYIESEWCQEKLGGPLAACDAYLLKRTEWIETARKNMRVEYFTKFAISKTGELLLVVSVHLSNK